MYNYLEKRNECRRKRALRVRKHLRGTAEKLRLSVVRSNAHLYAQLIDDDKGVTVGSYSSLHTGFDKEIRGKSKTAARVIGHKIAALAKEANVTNLVMDRGRNKYHGLIAELVTAVREAGIII
ncbi:MAG: 50S ribosomal protein L18 [Chlamydiae bacterium]|nr:50S ribosomal protein L18 [Chlamydiota bacterium]